MRLDADRFFKEHANFTRPMLPWSIFLHRGRKTLLFCREGIFSYICHYPFFRHRIMKYEWDVSLHSKFITRCSCFSNVLVSSQSSIRYVRSALWTCIFSRHDGTIQSRRVSCTFHRLLAPCRSSTGHPSPTRIRSFNNGSVRTEPSLHVHQ